MGKEDTMSDMTRRDFMRSAGAFTAALALPDHCFARATPLRSAGGRVMLGKSGRESARRARAL